MKGVSNPDGWVRLDFAGGWAGDKHNKFTAAGRTEQENEAFNYVKRLANYRKTSSAITGGKLTQYVPQEGVYTYFRHDDKQTVMIVMNTNKDEKPVDVNRFAERIKGFAKATSITTKETFNLNTTWKVPGNNIWIMELSK
jgi:glycosidase